MRRPAWFLFLLIGIVATPAVAAEPAYRTHQVVKLAEGVYAFLWKEAAVAPEPNVLIIINDRDVVVVDAEMYPSSARTVVKEIRRLTTKPVRYVVNTHWHDDHLFGNFVFRDAWPGVEFIAHANTRVDAESLAFAAIPKDLEQNGASLKLVQEILRTGKNPDGSAGSAAGLARLREETLPELELYLKDIPNVRPVLPDLTFTDSLVLHRGTRTIAVHYLGRGNTRGDVVVWLPDEKILATGDLVVWPTPFGIGSYYAEWARTLDRLAAFNAQTLFLGHGVMQHDADYVHQLRDLLDDMVSQVQAEVAKGATLDEVQRTVTLKDWEEKFAGEDRLKRQAFDEFFVQPAVERAYQQALAVSR
jgi:glyoxylase-like metal-dependent hydrolase (beta-lactamase superfamily II)